MCPNQSITFFDAQFQQQLAGNGAALNPFENVALPFLRGRVLDLGCGLGNVSIEAARRGLAVVAVDASETAIKRIKQVAMAEHLKIDAIPAEIGRWPIAEKYDTIIAIGLLMFFRQENALALLARIQEQVADQGVTIINVLIEGTTYLGMFEPGNYYLFGRNELEERFKGWSILLSRHDSFDAPGNTRKEFATIVARKN
jgi:tellurite methyltransferase